MIIGQVPHGRGENRRHAAGRFGKLVTGLRSIREMPCYSAANMETDAAFEPRAVALAASAEWMARGARFTPEEILSLFENNSPLLRDNPYALGVPANTLRALRSDWRMFLRFCAVNGYSPLPSSPAAVTRFIEQAYGSTVSRSVSTVERYLTTISRAHTLSNEPDPTRAVQVKDAFRHLSRGRAAKQPRCALRWTHIAYALEHLKTDNPAWDLRAKALLAVAYSTMARRSELVALTCEDINLNPETGDGVAIIRLTKVGREEARYLAPEAVTPLQAWLLHVGNQEGPIFRRLENTGAVGMRSIQPQEVARIIQRIARLLNSKNSASEPVWPVAHLAAHSTRIGAAHDMAATGIDLTSIMHSGGWTDPKMPRYYTRELAAGESGMARMMKARKENSRSGRE
jgi:site-specific recombinase XerD